MAAAHYTIELEHVGTWFRSWGCVVAFRFAHEANVVRVDFYRW
jgi:hypothetical protein